jgi:hypothetical protein
LVYPIKRKPGQTIEWIARAFGFLLAFDDFAQYRENSFSLQLGCFGLQSGF